jgi:hypothetical protein
MVHLSGLDSFRFSISSITMSFGTSISQAVPRKEQNAKASCTINLLARIPSGYNCRHFNESAEGFASI